MQSLGLHLRTAAIAIAALLCPYAAAAETPVEDSYSFVDLPTDYQDNHPDWFKQSFNNLPEDLADTLAAGKQGLIVYFGQSHCPYCQAAMKDNLSKGDLVHYLRAHFDVVGLNTHSTEPITGMDGATMPINEFAIAQKAQLTPTLLFYVEGRKLALKLVGYYPPYKMRAALEYVADGHYKTKSFAEYLEQADPPPLFADEALNPDPIFTPPPYALDRSRFAANKPLLVIFEQPRCHACDVLHTEPLQNPLVRERLQAFEVVQLNVWDDATPVLTPDGRRLTARKWAHDLELFYAPTLILFDEHGKEVMRIESVVQFFRLANVLRYVADKAYLKYPLFQLWNRDHAGEEVGLQRAAGVDK
ncbi:thioredoxin [Parasulfuritortus cantonensis]|uniref:Thioredoxin n=1 Tax=Parasulfuritortus cantonensis TaxID=2528202 RepID=A0A4R1B7I3_9PROT|nr:thioredoxin fold domain-containing protein [Parasulfuritortus cantonensis]TCJ11599.1 thioredoxin [Parasulfuritortus cantonensis]